MTLPILLAFCASSDRERVSAAADAISIYALFTEVGRCMAREGSRPLVLLAIGPEGGASLARWVEVYGLDGVAGIGLLGVTAPWAERIQRVDSRHAQWPCALPLGPLESLRAVAERARLCAPLCPSCRSERVRPDTDDCKHFICRCGHAFTPTPLRIVIACAPNDGVCATCGGTGRVPCNASSCVGTDHECDVCDGTGKALSSADVARELVGVDVGSTTDSIASGGTWVDVYSSNVALADHGLRTVIETLTR